MTRRFVTLHDEKWIKKNCLCMEDPIMHEYAWVPKVYKDDIEKTSVLIADNEREMGMYRSLVGKTIEVYSQPSEPKMDSYGFECAEGAPYGIPTWLIKAYWEIEE